eukprot:COSAG06_NODE_47295_length_340_cov_0.813278_1_plen_33_part_10
MEALLARSDTVEMPPSGDGGEHVDVDMDVRCCC